MTILPTKRLSVETRHAKIGEHDAIRSLVQTIVDEVYGGLWTSPPLQIGEEDWSRSWLALKDDNLIGMTLTQEDWVDDLWVNREHRGEGVGQMLLQRAEDEISGRGYPLARLRVVSSNDRAIRFYKRLGWKTERHFAHELFPINMTELSKRLSDSR